jgi:ATP synthase protein I
MANRDENAMWSIFGYLLSGLIFWGGIGYGLDTWLDKGIFTLIGLLVGISGAIYLVWLRFGRE